eukprot:3771199-Prymnesium_polylepis.1
MHAAHDHGAAAALRKARRSTSEHRDARGATRLYPSAGAELAAKGPAMIADAAFALDQRPVMNSITASPARPRARGSRP